MFGLFGMLFLTGAIVLAARWLLIGVAIVGVLWLFARSTLEMH